jgi:hypothetical protein
MTSASTRWGARRATPWGTLLLCAALLIALVVSLPHITRDGAYFASHDAPRYLMNSVFMHDLLASGAWTSPGDLVREAERYYARYPALSLGHHPPLLPAALVPFLGVLGVSVFAGRVALVVFFLAAVLLMHRVAWRFFDDDLVAGWSAVLFATSPTIGYYARTVLSELPTLALVLLAVLLLEEFRRHGRLRDYLLFVVAAMASVLCRPTAVFMAPAYAILALRGGGYRHWQDRRVAAITAVGVVCALGGAVAYLLLSPFNSNVVARIVREGVDWSTVEAMARAVTRERPLMVPVALGLLAGGLARDRRLLPPLAWALAVLVSATLVTGRISPARYAILAIPAICMLGASLASRRRPAAALAASGLLACVAGVQAWTTMAQPLRDGTAYEDAARYVVEHATGPTVLYSASVDTGYFVFFVRKHDPAQRLAVLRSDKLLTTSLMNSVSIEDRVGTPDEIHAVLQRFGVRLVVIEDRPSDSRVLEWLRHLVRTNQFAERARFPLAVGDHELAGVSLVVYEYLAATPPAPDAELDLNIPLVGRRVRVPLSDLAPRTP